MTDELMPEPESAGALVPPPPIPSTAIATAAPMPSRPSGSITPREAFFRDLVRTTLNTLDDVGDSIARAVGLR